MGAEVIILANPYTYNFLKGLTHSAVEGENLTLKRREDIFEKFYGCFFGKYFRNSNPPISLQQFVQQSMKAAIDSDEKVKKKGKNQPRRQSYHQNSRFHQLHVSLGYAIPISTSFVLLSTAFRFSLFGFSGFLAQLPYLGFSILR